MENETAPEIVGIPSTEAISLEFDAATPTFGSDTFLEPDAGPYPRGLDLSSLDPAPESASLAPLRDSYGCFIDGRFVPSITTFTTFNPATGEALSEIAQADEAQVDLAVQAARRAQPSWARLSGIERGKLLYRLARAIQDRSRPLAVLETLDGGKPIRESRDFDLPQVAQHFFHYAGWADKTALVSNRGPVGVVAAIVPWNFPLMMAAWKLAPALAAGNTVVLKPAETTSLTALALAEIIRDVGFPPGVVNVVTGDGRTGQALAQHPQIDKLAFTGSTGVGRALAREATRRRLPVTLELGGKSANIVYQDAPEGVIEGIVQSIFFNQGHVCCAGSRLLVQESVLDEVCDALLERMSTLRVGDPMDKNTDVGAINSPAQYERIAEMVRQAHQGGADIRQSQSCEAPYFSPTLVLDAAPSMPICRDEVFGPVLSVISFRTPQEAVELANDTPYGLAAGVWSSDVTKLAWTAQRLRAGVVWTNTYNRFDPASPFGGFKESGYGREGGRHGLEPYLA